MGCLHYFWMIDSSLQPEMVFCTRNIQQLEFYHGLLGAEAVDNFSSFWWQFFVHCDKLQKDRPGFSVLLTFYKSSLTDFLQLGWSNVVHIVLLCDCVVVLSFFSISVKLSYLWLWFSWRTSLWGLIILGFGLGELMKFEWICYIWWLVQFYYFNTHFSWKSIESDVIFNCTW